MRRNSPSHQLGAYVLADPLPEQFRIAARTRSRFVVSWVFTLGRFRVVSPSIASIRSTLGPSALSSRVALATGKRRGARAIVVSTTSTKPPMIADEFRRQCDHLIDLVKLNRRLVALSWNGGHPSRADRATRRTFCGAAPMLNVPKSKRGLSTNEINVRAIVRMIPCRYVSVGSAMSGRQVGFDCKWRRSSVTSVIVVMHCRELFGEKRCSAFSARRRKREMLAPLERLSHSLICVAILPNSSSRRQYCRHTLYRPRPSPLERSHEGLLGTRQI
jgi:hypothetical protein